MGHWEDIRAQARAHHARARLRLDDVPPARALLDEAARLTGVAYQELPAGYALLDGAEAVFDAECDTIWLNQDVPPARAAFYLAHEYAHVWLHRDYARCAEPDLDAGDGDAALSGAQRVEGYSLLERREREANAFAHVPPAVRCAAPLVPGQ